MVEDGGAALLEQGKAFVDLSFWRKVGISGPDALRWLDDLVTADLSNLAPGRSKRSLLLNRTGQIRAEFTVSMATGSLLLLQDPSQPHAIDSLLDRFVLSSDVEVEDRTAQLALLAFPGLDRPPQPAGVEVSRPSCLGSGLDLIAAAEDRERLVASFEAQHTQVGAETVELWRVTAGLPRFGVDATSEDLPLEAGLDDLVSYGKGCFLGQEAVAKVRNLGHPRRSVVQLEATGTVSPGDPVVLDGREVGQVTSVGQGEGRWRALARVAWDARSGPLRTATGTELRPPA